MSTITDALEVEVAAIRALRGQGGRARRKAAIDRHFARLMQLIAPRVRHFTRAYGLIDMADDAVQACAIGLHRAIQAYDPAKARFTTFVNWQLRGELQSLRFRLRADQRGSARRVGAATVSLDALEGLSLEDEEALERAEALAADCMARRACGRLLDEHAASMRTFELRRIERRKTPRGSETLKPGTLDPREINRVEQRIARERAIALAHLLGEDEALSGDGFSAEQRRQIARRTIRALSDRARGNPRYDPDALEAQPVLLRRH